VSKSTESSLEPPAVTGPADDEVAGHNELAIFSPVLPPARFVELPDRGTVMVRDFGGAPGAPVIALLHGWTATADLNWFRCYGALGERYRVIAFDHRGHGTGLRSKKPFRLEDCADDVIAMADALDIDTFIPVGYSMGGPIAQLVWRRHHERVSGLVLCATAPYFAGRREKRLGVMGFSGLAAVARVAPEQTTTWLVEQLYLQRRTAKWEPWALRETADHDWRTVIEAGKELGKFSSTDWIGQVDVPVSSVFTMRDQVVPLRRQVKLFEMIPDSEAFRVDGLHDAVVANADRFTPTLLRAIESVLRRS
jgi:3-oxoadipate enol-lactonase